MRKDLVGSLGLCQGQNTVEWEREGSEQLCAPSPNFQPRSATYQAAVP